MQSSPTRSRNKCTTIYRKSFTGTIATTASVSAALSVWPGGDSTAQRLLSLRHPHHVLRENKVTRKKSTHTQSPQEKSNGGYKRHDKERVEGKNWRWEETPRQLNIKSQEVNRKKGEIDSVLRHRYELLI